jgi:hypothetical protein
MSDERDDKGLRDETLSRAYRRTATGEPPAALDARILAAARREAALRPPSRSAPWWRRALAPVGILATIVLTVSLTLMVEREQHEPLPAAAPAAAPAAVPAPEQAQASAEPVAKPAAPADAKAKVESRRSEQAPAAAAPAAVLEEAAPVPQPATQPNSALESRQNEVPAAASAPPPAVMQKAAPEAKSVQVAPAPAGAAAMPERLRAVMSAPRRESAAADKAVQAPDEWIEDIRRLKREGREREAVSQLAAFRLAYPDYRLPDDLKAP